MKKFVPAGDVSSPGAPSPALRAFLHVTAAVCGAAVMIVEILGAKLLAPHLGTSHFVWTAQIAVTLVALAVGYYVGGRVADRHRGPRPLFLAVILAAGALIVSVAAADAVARWASGWALPTAALVSSSCLFFVPLALLATCVPFLIGTLAPSLDRVGGVVGRLSAVSTAGSLAGTLLVGYVLIPLLPNSRIMFVTAASLLACAAVYFAVWGRRRTPVALLIIAATAAIGVRASAAPAWQGTRLREVFRGNSNFGQLQVLETHDGRHRTYVNDLLTQNQYDVVSRRSTNAFTYVLHRLAKGYVPRLDRALCIGMGVGIVPMTLAREGVAVDVVEINPAVVPLAVRFFDFDPTRVSVSIDDGRHALRVARTGTYDVIVLDAFLGDSSPSHLMTREAFAEAARVLKPDGALVINSFGELGEGQDAFPASLARTLQAVFPSVRVHHMGGGNVYFVGSRRAELPRPNFGGFDDVHDWARIWVWRSLENGGAPTFAGGLVLTDDFNPIDVLDAASRERMRRSLVAHSRLD